MSNVLSNAKRKLSNNKKGQHGENPGQQFTAQPHPAKTNDPRDSEPSVNGPESKVDAPRTQGPNAPSQDTVDSLEQPSSWHEFRRRVAEINIAIK